MCFIILFLQILQINSFNFVSNFSQDTSLQINLPNGVIQGVFKQTLDAGMPYYSYEGIPYAKPPVGELRFRPPIEPDKWEGILNASKNPPACIQVPTNNKYWYESEDCLYLNVYTPIHIQMQKPRDLLPVMVWIYGGAFLFGLADSTYFGPDNLLQENVIVVHFNYRLNVFGFLSTNDLVSPGNYGLKDQKLALEWVQKHIKLFGGNPEQVTVFGNSAGSVSVQYHLLTSHNLFQRAISQSGSILCPWAYQMDPSKVAFQLGAVSGLATNNSQELVDFLRSLNVKQLKRATLHVLLINSITINKGLAFTPVVEPVHNSALITYNNWELLTKGDYQKIPYIIGFTSQESGSAQAAFKLGEPFLFLLNASPSILVPAGMKLKSRDVEKVGSEIKKHYFNTTKPKAEQYLDFISDSYFYRPIIQSAKLISLHLPTFMYKFSYEGFYLGRKALSVNQDVEGVMHSEEIWYLFTRDDLTRTNETDDLIRKRLVKLWTNFAKFGNPTPAPDPFLDNVSWPQISFNDVPYLDINYEMKVRSSFKNDTITFWDDLYNKYGNPPFYTY